MQVDIGAIAVGVLVNAITATGRLLLAPISAPLRDRRLAGYVTIARWLDTYQLTKHTPPLPNFPPALNERLVEVLQGNEFQAILQELLAARLTDASEADVSRIRSVWDLTLAESGVASATEALFDYYDEMICDLVGRLEGGHPPVLREIRDAAYNTRIIAVLNAIERHTAALSTGRGGEAAFLASYRRHVIDQHGKIQPPDFERRRRVPIKDIYVPTSISKEGVPERNVVSSKLSVWQLTEESDRTALLGDPGSGKTTAANVLMHHHGVDTGRLVPFLVTLRDFAALDQPERSVVGYIDHLLETFYQCPAPRGLVDRLLLTGRALVIFDGLDELLDTSHRADVSARIERFCAEYPLARVLVTSRLVGYDQARLDDQQFTCYRLGGFGDHHVREFVRKWFAQEADISAVEALGRARSFLVESANISDLCTNPLLLSLLCILYRGEGSLPRSRAEVYKQCSNLLFRSWDARRRIYQALKAEHLLERGLEYLAWWLFTRQQTQPAVSERELINETTIFLHGRGFESELDARDAASEFIEFCRGRKWVFSDTGTTASGEHLYSFTHRTFMEYFAAAKLAHDSDTPEQLARTLAPHVARDEWWVVAELAVQIKDSTSTDGAPRTYAALIGDLSHLSTEDSSNLLRFLCLCLRSVDPSPQRVRELTRDLIERTVDAERTTQAGDGLSPVKPLLTFSPSPLSSWQNAVCELFARSGSYRDTVADEIDTVVAEKIRSSDRGSLVSMVRFVASLCHASPESFWENDDLKFFWISRADDLIQINTAAVVAAAETDAFVRLIALQTHLLTMREALSMTGGLRILSQGSVPFFRNSVLSPYLAHVFSAFLEGWPAFGEVAIIDDLVAVAEYLLNHPEPPWVFGASRRREGVIGDEHDKATPGTFSPLNNMAYFGAAVILSVMTESAEQTYQFTPRKLGPLGDLFPYLARRQGANASTGLPDLPLPYEFEQTFRRWAEGRVNFTSQA